MTSRFPRQDPPLLCEGGPGLDLGVPIHAYSAETTFPQDSLQALLGELASHAPTLQWAFYRAGEKLHRIGQDG